MKLPTKEKQTLEGHYGPVNIAYFNNDGQYVLSGGQDKSVKLWSVLKENQGGKGVCLKTYSGHGREIYDIAITNDNSKFATCGGDKAIFYWDVMTGRTIRRYQGHYQRINCVDFNKEASVVVSGSSDMSIRIWDCRSQSRLPIQILEDAKDSITSLQVSDHEILASSVDGNIRIYDIRMGSLISDKIGLPVSYTSFSTDGNCILASTLNSKLYLIDKENGQILNCYSGHKNEEYKLSSCLDNTDAYVISGSEDGKIIYWDLVDGIKLETIEAHKKVVTSVKYHPKDSYLLSASHDGLIKIWSI